MGSWFLFRDRLLGPAGSGGSTHPGTSGVWEAGAGRAQGGFGVSGVNPGGILSWGSLQDVVGSGWESPREDSHLCHRGATLVPPPGSVLEEGPCPLGVLGVVVLSVPEELEVTMTLESHRRWPWAVTRITLSATGALSGATVPGRGHSCAVTHRGHARGCPNLRLITLIRAN